MKVFEKLLQAKTFIKNLGIGGLQFSFKNPKSLVQLMHKEPKHLKQFSSNWVRIGPTSSLGHTHLFVIFLFTFKCKFLLTL
jgi:hypothetical protein